MILSLWTNWEDRKKRPLWICVLYMLYVYSTFSSRPSKTMVCESPLTTTSPCFSFKLSYPVRKAELWLKIYHCNITVAFTDNCYSVWAYQNLMLGIRLCYPGKQVANYSLSRGRTPIFMLWKIAVKKCSAIMEICPVPLQSLCVSRCVQEK